MTDYYLNQVYVTSLQGRTSIRLEPEFEQALEMIRRRESCTRSDIVRLIEKNKPKEQSLSSAVRVFCMLYYNKAATPEGHVKAGHGKLIKKLKNNAKP